MKNKKGFTLVELLSIVVILGILAAIALPAVSKFVMSSRKKTLMETVSSYMSSVTIEVNNKNFYFSGRDTIFAVPIECIDVDKGGTDPFGVWLPATSSKWAYVLVQFDYINKEYIYGFTFKDNQGFGLYPTSQKYLDEDGSQVINKIEISKPVSGSIESITTLDRWQGFLLTDETELVVLRALPKGEEGDGKTTCTLMQDITEALPEPEPDPVPQGPQCKLEVMGTLGANGWYKGDRPMVQFKDVSSIVGGSDIADYGIGVSSTAEFNKNTSHVISDIGITTVYGYVKDKDGNTGTCSVEVKYDNRVLANAVNFGYQVYPKSDMASTNGQYININNYISDYGEVLGINLYLKSNNSGMTVKVLEGGSTLSTRTVSAGVTFMNFSFEKSLNSLKIDMGNGSNISLIERIEVITDHTTGFYTNYDVYAYAISSDSTQYSFDGKTYQTSNKMIYSTNKTNASLKTKDNLGNESTVLNFSINNIDKNVPICESNDGNTTWAKSKTVKERCQDLDSGCRNEYYSVTYPTGSIKNIKTGKITIYDKAGNSTDCSVNVYVDSTPPVCSVNMTNSSGSVSSGSTVKGDVTFSGTGTDNESNASGISSVTWKVTKGSNTYNNLSSTSGMGTGTYSVYATCTDIAGNSSTSATKTVKVSQSVLISFNKNGGSGSMSNLECDVDTGCTLTANSFIRTGHKFIGWATSSNGSKVYSDVASIKVSSDTVLYAKWQAETYTITYGGSGYTNHTSNPTEYTYGIGATLYPASKTNYNFVGWYLNASLTTAIDNISASKTGDLTLYPKFSESVYTLTYHNEGGSGCSSRNGISGETWGSLCIPNYLGHEFKGWYTGVNGTGTNITANSTVTGDLDVYAYWGFESYTITYVNGSHSSNPSSYTYGTGVSSFYSPSKTGHSFGGWYSDSSYATRVTSISSTETGDKILYAKFTPNNYTITYDSQGGTTCSSTTREYNETFGALCNTTRTGYVFNGWYTGTNGTGTKISATTKVTKSITVYASWSPITYTIEFDGNGATSGSTASVTCTYDSNCTLTANGFSKTSNDFAGWATSSSGNVIYSNNASVKNLASHNNSIVTLYAKWSAKSYTLTYDSQGGSTCSPSSKTGVYGNMWGNLCTPTKTGYAFKGWYTSTNGGGTQVTASTSISKSMTVYAYWSPITYTIAFNGNGSTSGSTASVTCTYDSSCTLTTNGFSKTNNDFAGWATSSSSSVVYNNTASVKNLSSTQGGTVTLYAKWTAKTYTLTYDSQSGSYCSPKNGTHGSTWGDLCVPTRTGYTFGAWYTGKNGTGTKVTSSSTVNSDLTVYAYWEPNQYTLTYVVTNGNGCDGTTKTGRYNQAWGELCTPTRSGYSFNGWYTAAAGNGTNITASSLVSGDVTVYASWSVNQTYSITYYLDGGTNHGSNPSTYTYGVGVSSFYNPTKTGYKFKGWHSTPNWTSSTQITSIGTTETGNKELYAAWETPQVYTITYVLNGGTNSSSNPSSYTEGTGVSYFYFPTRSGYAFDGWYSDSSYTTSVISIPTTATGNKTLYAKWLAKPVLTCNSDNYSWSNVSSSVDISATDADGDFKNFYYKRYNLDANYTSTTSNPFKFTGAYYKILVYAADKAGNNSASTFCYTKFDNVPYYAPIVLSAKPGQGSESIVNVKSIRYECENSDTTLTTDRVCYSYITRIDSTKTAYDSYSWNTSNPSSTAASGISPWLYSYTEYYYRTGTTCKQKASLVDNKWKDDIECVVYSVDYRVMYFEDEAGNRSPKLYLYSVWDGDDDFVEG